MMFLQITLAHIIGDFVLQPDKWVDDKNQKKLNSPKLYLHLAVHSILLAIFLGFNIKYWIGYIVVISSHFIIDVIKAYITSNGTEKKRYFFLDQLFHILIIACVTYFYNPFNLSLTDFMSYNNVLFALALVTITSFSSVFVNVCISKMNPEKDSDKNNSLENAGKYIGMLERVFVFLFVIIGRWEMIGFLLAAKSVFRFGDLKESKDRKLTEYMLIGTLFSFGIAILTGLLYLKLKHA